MLEDARGLPTAATHSRSIEACERAIVAFQTYRGDPLAHIQEAIDADRGWAGAHIAKALILMTFFERRFARDAAGALAEKGFQPATADGQPDVILGYYVALDSRVDVQQVNSYYGGYYGWGRGAYWGGAYPSTSVRYYDQGTLILDVADAKKKELVWRGTGQAEVHQSDPDRRQQRLEDAVRQILKDFPPTPKK